MWIGLWCPPAQPTCCCDLRPPSPRGANQPACSRACLPPCSNAVVLPAFETQDEGEAGKRVALEAVRQGKEYVVNKFQ